MNILITGGSSGIGACFVAALTPAHVVDAPPRTELDLCQKISYPLDQYDVLILCAGSDIGGKKNFCDMKDQHWLNTLQVNLVGNMQLIKNYVTARKGRWGKIIVIGSTATDHVWPAMIPYSISKLALEQFCRALRQELPDRMGVSVLRPGLVRTGFHRARCQGFIGQDEEQAWYDSKPHLVPQDLVPAMLSMVMDRDHAIKEITISS